MAAAAREDLPVLIVDDDEDAHFFLSRELARAGISSIESTFGGADAIAYLNGCVHGARRMPRLLFLDVMMPGTDGFRVLEWMHAKGLLAQVIVAMLTSSENPADVARAVARGAHVYLTKPAKVEELRPVIAAAAHLRGAVSPTRHS